MDRVLARNLVNRALRPAGVRVVNREWGPRGFAASFERLRAQGFAPEVILDIGAARGTWSAECMTVFPQARYYLLDALPENEAALRAFCAEQPRARFHIGALGAQAGEAEFRVHGDQSSFFDSEFDATGTKRVVSVETLDGLLEQGKIEAPDLLKADVQGFELEILRGGPRVLAKAQYVLLEVLFRQLYDGAPLAHEVIAAMGDWGFRIYDFCAYCQRPTDGELAYSDILFARVDAPVFEDEGYGTRRRVPRG